MTTTTTMNETLTIRGTEYRVRGISEDKGHLGSRFFGKRVFSLMRVADGVRFTYFGKRPTGNARVRLDSSAYTVSEPRDGLHDDYCTRILARQYNGDLMCPCMLRNYVPRPAQPVAFHRFGCSGLLRPRGTAGLMCDCAAGWCGPDA